MIDIHCHILPGIDDGAQSAEDSLTLARAAVDNGITHAVCTPHIHFGRFENSKQGIASRLTDLQDMLTKHEITLTVAAAAEVRFDVQVLSEIDKGKIPYAGVWRGNKVLLLELPTGEFPRGTDQLIHLLKERNVTAMIAHPERNKGILRDATLIPKLIGSGCLLQITAASLLGNFGSQVQQCAQNMIREDVVHAIATDAHHHKKRPPLLKQAYELVSSIAGPQQAYRLTHDIPWEISESLFTS